MSSVRGSNAEQLQQPAGVFLAPRPAPFFERRKMPFTLKVRGGNGLQAALDDLKKKLGADQTVDQETLRVGILEGSTYPDGMSVATVAAVQEFGAAIEHADGHTTTNPPRPFMRNTVRHNRGQWGPLLGAALKASKLDTTRALGVVGLKIASQMQDEIKATSEPPNAPSTVKAKGFNKPLIDTGTLLRSIDFEVVEK